MNLSRHLLSLSIACSLLGFAPSITLAQEAAESRQTARITPDVLPTAPAEWAFTSATPFSGAGGPTSTGMPPNIQIAAVSGTKHVLDCINISAQQQESNGLFFVKVQLLDGSNPVMQWLFYPPQANSTNLTSPNIVSLCGLSLVGTAGNAMSLVASQPSTFGQPSFPTPVFITFNITGHDAQ